MKTRRADSLYLLRLGEIEITGVVPAHQPAIGKKFVPIEGL